MENDDVSLDSINEEANDIVASQSNKLSHDNTITDIPVDIKYDEEAAPFFNNPNLKPLTQESPKSPGFFETVGMAVKRDSELGVYFNQEEQLPLYDPVDPNWDPKADESNMAGVRPQYQGMILGASGPNDQRRLHYKALDMQEADDYYNRGSFTAHLIGGIAAYNPLASPSMAIPLGVGLKYASLSTALLENIGRVAPAIAASSIAHNAYIETKKEGGNLEDFVDNSFNDTISGIAFMGAGYGLSHAYSGIKLWNVKRILNLTQKGIDITHELAPDGSIIKHIASSENLSAAEVNFATDFINSKMAQEGMFSWPIVGQMIGKGAAKFNPIIRMLNSRFPTMAGFIDRVASHGIVTTGNIRGEASPIKFENLIDFVRSVNTVTYTQIKALHLERNGIEVGNAAKNAINKAKAAIFNKDEYTSEQKFQSEISEVLRTEEPSPHTSVNTAAAILRPLIDHSWEEMRAAYNLPPQLMPPKTSNGYVMRVYNVHEMEQRQDDWVHLVSSSLAKQDLVIEGYMRPIKELSAKVKEAEKNPAFPLNELMAMKRALKSQKDAMHNRLRDDPKLRILIEDSGALSAKEAVKLRKLLKPLNQAKKELDKSSEQLKALKFELLKMKDKHGEPYKALKKKVSELEVEHNKIKTKVSDQESMLQQKAHNGEIDPIFYMKDQNVFNFKSPKDKLKFRKTYESHAHRQRDALAYYDTILNQTAEDTMAQVIGTSMGRHGENHMKQRSLMIPDEDFVGGNFLSNDLMVNVSNYRLALGRRTALKTVFQDVSIDGGIKPITESLLNDFKVQKAAIDLKIKEIKDGTVKVKNKEKELKKLEKEINTLQKDFKDAKENMNLSYEKMMGRTRGSRKVQNFTRILRNFAVATKLGAVPLTMITDLMAIAMKHGVWPSIRDGLMPMLQNIAHLTKNGKDSTYRDNAAHAHIGYTYNLAAEADRNWAGSTQPYTPLAGKIANGMENMAHLSQNLAGTNMLENNFQRQVAGIVQSKIMRYLLDFKEGKLSAKDKEKLLVYGLQPEKWADRMIEGWKKAGKDGNGFGGYQARYWEWEDKEAANMFASIMRNGTKDTIIRKGMFDAPFALDDPWIGTMFMFKGWVAASLTRYLTPLMQRPDAEKIIGTVLMLAAGSMVTPLRRLAKGENPIEEDDNMFRNALVDGGVLSFPAELIEMLNGMSGGNLLPQTKNDKFRDRTIAGWLAGPIGGQANDLVHILKMMGTANFNQTDIKKMVRMTPAMQPWYLRGATNKMIEATGLPQTYSEASR